MLNCSCSPEDTSLHFFTGKPLLILGVLPYFVMDICKEKEPLFSEIILCTLPANDSQGWRSTLSCHSLILDPSTCHSPTSPSTSVGLTEKTSALYFSNTKAKR